MLGGGYGSAIGAMFGALIFGVVQMGIFYTGIDTDWFKAFMGAMLLAAVLFNDYTRRNVEMNAFYALRDTAGRIVLRERAEIVTGFDEFDDPLNDLSSLAHRLPGVPKLLPRSRQSLLLHGPAWPGGRAWRSAHLRTHPTQ